MDAETWNEIVHQLPGGHILQTWEWGLIKGQYGWQAIPRVWQGETGRPRAAGMVLRRTIPVGGLAPRLSILYVPRGPLLAWEDSETRRQVLDDLQVMARKSGAIFIKIDPEVVLGTGLTGAPDAQESGPGQTVVADLQGRGWRFSGEQVQFRNTIWLEVNRSDEQLLAGMKPKTRYNIRLAQRKGVQVRRGNASDFPLLYRMYAETAVRDHFVIRPQEYYYQVWQVFSQQRMAETLIAEVEGEPVAGLVLFFFGKRAWYLYGMSRDIHRDKMPNYLLQWEAIKRARDRGCTIYDLWGAPDVFQESDPLWNVYRFKEGLGGKVVRTLGAWDYAPYPPLYALYTHVLPRFLDLLRRRGKARLRREIDQSAF